MRGLARSEGEERRVIERRWEKRKEGVESE